jgi:hypothetical protein
MLDLPSAALTGVHGGPTRHTYKRCAHNIHAKVTYGLHIITRAGYNLATFPPCACNIHAALQPGRPSAVSGAPSMVADT